MVDLSQQQSHSYLSRVTLFFSNSMAFGCFSLGRIDTKVMYLKTDRQTVGWLDLELRIV